MTDPNETIEDRESQYGDFARRAEISRQIKAAMKMPSGWSALTDAQREALEMIAVKISRILNGDPNYADSWHDIAGYAMLVEKQLVGAVNKVVFATREEAEKFRAAQLQPADTAADKRKADYFAEPSFPVPCLDQSLRCGCLVLCKDDVVRKVTALDTASGIEFARLRKLDILEPSARFPVSFIRHVTAQPDGA